MLLFKFVSVCLVSSVEHKFILLARQLFVCLRRQMNSPCCVSSNLTRFLRNFDSQFFENFMNSRYLTAVVKTRAAENDKYRQNISKTKALMRSETKATAYAA